MKGKWSIYWHKEKGFTYTPDKDTPLIFIRNTKDCSETDKQIVRPKDMYTDGGSIPKLLCVFKQYDPWHYAPAYMMHDWVFEVNHCEHSQDKYTFKDSADIMAESLKATIEQYEMPNNHFVFGTIILATASSIALDLWINGSCDIPKDKKKGRIEKSSLPEVKKEESLGEIIKTMEL